MQTMDMGRGLRARRDALRGRRAGRAGALRVVGGVGRRAAARAHVPPARPGRRRRPSGCACRGVLDLVGRDRGAVGVHDRADLDAQDARASSAGPCSAGRSSCAGWSTSPRAGTRARPRGGGRAGVGRDGDGRAGHVEPRRRAPRRRGRVRARASGSTGSRSTCRRSRSAGSTASAGSASRRSRRGRGARTTACSCRLRGAVRAVRGVAAGGGRGPRLGVMERHERAGSAGTNVKGGGDGRRRPAARADRDVRCSRGRINVEPARTAQSTSRGVGPSRPTQPVDVAPIRARSASSSIFECIAPSSSRSGSRPARTIAAARSGSTSPSRSSRTSTSRSTSGASASR